MQPAVNQTNNDLAHNYVLVNTQIVWSEFIFRMVLIVIASLKFITSDSMIFHLNGKFKYVKKWK